MQTIRKILLMLPANQHLEMGGHDKSDACITAIVVSNKACIRLKLH